MNLIKRLLSYMGKNNGYVFVHIILINLPLFILTFDTYNWSDDFQLTNLLAVKAEFSPLMPLLGGIEGGHFTPVYMLINILITKISFDPRLFHFVILLFFVLTAFLLYLIVKTHYEDIRVAMLSATLFSLNYYISFKSLAWNCFHGHTTNTFFGIASIYGMLLYFKNSNFIFIFLSGLCFLFTILDQESGFVFFPIIIIILVDYAMKRKIQWKDFVQIALIFSLLMCVYPLAAYALTGKANPLAYRFQKQRNVQNYAYLANDLLIRSTGVALAYNKLIFDPLRTNQTLKEAFSNLIKRNDPAAMKAVPRPFLIMLGMLALSTVVFAIFLAVMIWTKIRPDTKVFVYIYGCLFLIYVFVFHRVDIASVIGIFSSIIIADFILSLLADKKQTHKRLGWGIAVFYVAVAAGTLFNRFEDCYGKAFFFFTRKTLHGPQRVYDAMNKKLGHWADRGLLFFTHDYSPYRQENGERRIGDMVWLGDFACYNATVFYKDLLNTDIIAMYKNRPFSVFVGRIRDNPKNQRIYVESKNDAFRYLQEHKVDLNETDALYMSWDYQIENLKDAL